MDIKRTVLWVVLSVSLLILWDNWMRYNGKPSMFFPTATQQAKPSTAAGTSPSLTKSDVPQTSATSTASLPTGTTPTTASATATPGEIITITTDVVKAQFDTAGGRLRHLELLKHKDMHDPQKNEVLFDISAKRTYVAETGLIGGPFPNHNSSFVAKPGARSLDNATEVQLVLESVQGDVKLTKTYTLKRGDYTIDVKHTATNLSGAPIAPSLYLQILHDGNKPADDTMFMSSYTGPSVYTEAEKFQKLDFSDIEKKKAKHATKADNGWIALVQHYFVSAFIPPEKAPREIFTKTVDTNLYAIGTILPMGTIAPGATASVDARLYSGPQETSVLEALAPGLELVKDYGVLTIIAKPLFWVMSVIHGWLNNWGWTIIAFTILIKLCFFHLSAAGYRSMAKMRVVTPKMTAIRERHKGDPQKMNQAMMEMYKTEKINPLGGCLPLLVQMPVFFALYWVLQASVEMRGAPWIGWIQNLAAPDPWFILPVVYAVSMFITTKLSPAPADPMQAKVMLYMPLVFSVMFFFFPAGLVLYWVVNNILSIAQQWAITKSIEGAKPS